MNPDKTQEANPEQLLKLLELQVASARAQRAARESGRRKAGTVGIVFIVGGASVALWVLSVLLDQMRPERGERRAGAGNELAQHAR